MTSVGGASISDSSHSSAVRMMQVPSSLFDSELPGDGSCLSGSVNSSLSGFPRTETSGNSKTYKLFIGQIPKDLIEEDIFPVFSSFGPIAELHITREPLTSIKSIKYNNKLNLASKLSGAGGDLSPAEPGYQQLSRGYGFVTYLNLSDSLRCKETLNNKYIFPSNSVCYSPSGQPTQRKPVQIREAIENYAEMVAEKREEVRGWGEGAEGLLTTFYLREYSLTPTSTQPFRQRRRRR